MYGLAEKIAKAGYKAKALDYPSTRRTIPEHGKWFSKELEKYDADPDVLRIHVVTHSMGGIVTRESLNNNVPKKMGRVVMLAAPNKGSPGARRWRLLTPFFKSMAAMSDAPDSYVNTMGEPDGVEIGNIAGRSDAKVPVSFTHLDSQADHIVVDGYHTWIMDDDDVARYVINFLMTGRFKK